MIKVNYRSIATKPNKALDILLFPIIYQIKSTFYMCITSSTINVAWAESERNLRISRAQSSSARDAAA